MVFFTQTLDHFAAMSSRRGGRRSGPQNADLSNPVNLEMLSAYTVNAGSAAPSEADKTFLNKRNKNQKKREMQAQKQVWPLWKSIDTAKQNEK